LPPGKGTSIYHYPITQPWLTTNAGTWHYTHQLANFN